MKNYTHINDCWGALRKAKTIDEVNNLFKEFPRWSGSWEVQIEKGFYNKSMYVVYNSYFDTATEDEVIDAETLDIEVP